MNYKKMYIQKYEVNNNSIDVYLNDSQKLKLPYNYNNEIEIINIIENQSNVLNEIIKIKKSKKIVSLISSAILIIIVMLQILSFNIISIPLIIAIISTEIVKIKQYNNKIDKLCNDNFEESKNTIESIVLKISNQKEERVKMSNQLEELKKIRNTLEIKENFNQEMMKQLTKKKRW